MNQSNLKSIEHMNVPFARVDCSGNEYTYVKEVLDSGWLTTASKAKRLEEKFSELIGCKHSVAVNSCTSALHLALDACGVKAGDKVILPSLTFTATAEVVRYMGADPVLTDVDFSTAAINSALLEKALDENPEATAVIVVHYGGYPLEMHNVEGSGFADICKKRNVCLISDAAHALPAHRNGEYIGNSGDITCFSFYANKTITTGEGGMLVTNSDEYAKRARLMRLHGIDRDVWDRFTNSSNGWEYDVTAPGFKYNMPDLNAAVGLAQFERIEEMRSRREQCARIYLSELATVGCLDLITPDVSHNEHSWHLFPIILRDDSPIERNELIDELADRGVGTSVHYKPIHRLSYYKDTYKLNEADFPVAERIWRNCISLPIYSSMTADEVRYVCSQLKLLLSDGPTSTKSSSVRRGSESIQVPAETPGWPNYNAEEIAAVSSVLSSNKVNYWTGDVCKNFEQKYANYFGQEYGVAMANGTVVLDAALIASGIKQGDEVIVPPRTYIASVSSIVNVGAIPVFADVDLDSQNITPESIEKCIAPKTKGIMCVHLAGWPCEMKEIMSLASQHNLVVIEDCAQSHGAKIHGQYAGSYGTVAGWSFCQDKIMTTGGEGGMATTDNEEIWQKIWSLKDHGKSWDAVYSREHPPGFRWLHDSFGTNLRMTEMQAAIGNIQLGRLEDWVTTNGVCQDRCSIYLRCFFHFILWFIRVKNHGLRPFPIPCVTTPA